MREVVAQAGILHDDSYFPLVLGAFDEEVSRFPPDKVA